MPPAIHAADDEPIIERGANGTVHVSYDEGLHWITFRTPEHWNAVREFCDREQVDHEHEAVAAYIDDRDGYFARMQALRAERDLLHEVTT